MRYWEQEFTQLKPVKRRGNRRYYQRQDVILIRQIRTSLYEQGFTIGGARQRWRAAGDAVEVTASDKSAGDQGIDRRIEEALTHLAS